jgi:hypothetical protein
VVAGGFNAHGAAMLAGMGVKIDFFSFPSSLPRAFYGTDVSYDALQSFDNNFASNWSGTASVSPIFCLDNTLFLGEASPAPNWNSQPRIPGESISWIEIGQHIKFNRAVELVADDYLKRLFNVSRISQVPEFIGIHLRRHDFEEFTGLTALEFFVAALNRLRADFEARWDLTEYPVIFASDESGSSDFIKACKMLGWRHLDHEQVEDKTFDAWWPAIIDSVVLSRAKGFVGTPKSTFSDLAALRVK